MNTTLGCHTFPTACLWEKKNLQQQHDSADWRQKFSGSLMGELLNMLVYRSFFSSLNVKDNARKHTWRKVDWQKQRVKKKRSYLI